MILCLVGGISLVGLWPDLSLAAGEKISAGHFSGNRVVLEFQQLSLSILTLVAERGRSDRD